MFSNRLDLERGDLIEILYRVWRRAAEGEEQIERWFVAEIIDCEPGTQPLAQIGGRSTDRGAPLYDMASPREGRPPHGTARRLKSQN